MRSRSYFIMLHMICMRYTWFSNTTIAMQVKPDSLWTCHILGNMFIVPWVAQFFNLKFLYILLRGSLSVAWMATMTKSRSFLFNRVQAIIETPLQEWRVCWIEEPENKFFFLSYTFLWVKVKVYLGFEILDGLV